MESKSFTQIARSIDRDLYEVKVRNMAGVNNDHLSNCFPCCQAAFEKENLDYTVSLKGLEKPSSTPYLKPSAEGLAVLAMASSHGSVAHLLPQTYKRMVSAWLEEDCPSFDYGGFVVGESTAEAILLGKSPGMVAGVPFFDEVFRQLDCTYDLLIFTRPLYTKSSSSKTS